MDQFNLIQTKNHCFICIKRLNVAEPLNNLKNYGAGDNSSYFSLELLCRYLKLNLGAFLNFEKVFQTDEVRVTLCDTCRLACHDILERFQLIERLELELYQDLDNLSNKMKEADGNAYKMGQLKQKFNSESQLKKLEEMRNAFLSKCHPKHIRGQPQVQLQKLDANEAEIETERILTETKPNDNIDTDAIPIVFSTKIIKIEVDEFNLTDSDPPPPILSPQLPFPVDVPEQSSPKSWKRKTTVTKTKKIMKIPPNYTGRAHSDLYHYRHTSDGRFKCTICRDRTFNFRAGAIDHCKSFHIGLRYNCGIGQCDKSFVRQETAKKHRLRCKGKPAAVPPFEFECKICKRKFIKGADLNYHHKIVHLNIRNHPCPLCPLRFKQNVQMLRHKKAIHENVKVYCDEPGCGKAYCRPDYLKVHIKRAHLRNMK